METKLLSLGLASLLAAGCATAPGQPGFSTQALEKAPELSKPGNGFYEGWPAKWFMPSLNEKNPSVTNAQAPCHVPDAMLGDAEPPASCEAAIKTKHDTAKNSVGNIR